MSDDTLTKLEQLTQLRKSGTITAPEFDQQLADLLPAAQRPPATNSAQALLAMTNPAPWSYLKTFWLETLRTGLLTGVGLLATSLLLNPIQGAITKQADASLSQAQASISERDKDIRIKLVDQFLEKSFVYTTVMNQAQTSFAYRRRYRGSADEDFSEIKNRLRFYYATQPAILDSLTQSDVLASRIFEAIDAGLPKQRWRPSRDRLKRLNNQIAVRCLQAVGVQVEQPGVSNQPFR